MSSREKEINELAQKLFVALSAEEGPNVPPARYEGVAREFAKASLIYAQAYYRVLDESKQ